MGVSMSGAEPAACTLIRAWAVDLVEPCGDVLALTCPPVLARQVVPFIAVRDRVVGLSGTKKSGERAASHF